MSDLVIEVDRLEKYFRVQRSICEQLCRPFGSRGKVCALRGVSFEVRGGEILGVVGANGAGKTTLLRILAGLVSADGGGIRMLGEKQVCHNRILRGRIGYVSSDERNCFWRLTGRENLEFFGRLYGLSAREARRRTREMLGRFGFAERADELFRDYSGGMRRKVAIMRGLLHRPQVLLVDEVTNSLDFESCELVKRLLREYVCDGRAVVWSTHRVDEIGEICDRVIMLDKGEVGFEGCVGEFFAKERDKTMSLAEICGGVNQGREFL